ncbi:PilZ domain-containing protein [Sphingomonas swuensis]
MDSCYWSERNPRQPVELVAEVVHADGRVSSAIVTNLSDEGCGVAGVFLIGERVTLILPDAGPIEGQVRWAFNGEGGVLFDREKPSPDAG